MAFKFSKIRSYAYVCGKTIACTVGVVVCGLPIGLLYAGLIAHFGIKSRIREAKFRKIKSSSPRKFRTFPPFHLLPKELQLAIWKFAIQDIKPRTVKLKLYWWQYKVPQSGFRPFLGSILTAHHEYQSEIPNLLHICHDSRKVAQEKYKLSFSDLLQERPVYFDIERDTLWVVAGGDHCPAFPLRFLGMEGFRNLIITPSPRILYAHDTATSFEPLQSWLMRLLSPSIGGKIRIQVVLEQADIIYNDIGRTEAERCVDEVRNICRGFFHPSIKVVHRVKLDFGGGVW